MTQPTFTLFSSGVSVRAPPGCVNSVPSTFNPLLPSQRLANFSWRPSSGSGCKRCRSSRSRRQSSSSCFTVRCMRELFPDVQWALPRPFSRMWKEGLFLIRCTIFAAVLSLSSVMVWYAQAKTCIFVETKLLPSACTILREFLQRELSFGKVKSVSPLGITLQSCSIGPHSEEFSCGEVPVMKLRVRPFASLKKGKIVIDAVLSDPCILVSQRKDYSWLGIPPPSDRRFEKRHSGEEGIDHRTKTRRTAREAATAHCTMQRDMFAREAAETGYALPVEELVAGSLTDGMLGVRGSGDFPEQFLHMEQPTHAKGHICTDSRLGYNSKHADLEKSFGLTYSVPEIKLPSRMVPTFSNLRFRRNTQNRAISTSDNCSRQRILSQSALAAASYFMHLNCGKPGDVFPEGVKDSSDLEYDRKVYERRIEFNEGLRDGPAVEPSRPHSLGSKVQMSHEVFGSQLSESSIHESTLKFNEDQPRKEGGQINFQGKAHGKFGGYMQMHWLRSFWPLNFNLKINQFPFNVMSDHLVNQLLKLKTQLVTKPDEIAKEFLEAMGDNETDNIGKGFSFTLDTVYFTGGTLMLLGYGDKEPREMKNVGGHVTLQNNYNRVHVNLSGNCMEWRHDRTTLGGGNLSIDVFVDILEQNWHANLTVMNLFAPLFERILEIPVNISKGRATGEVHICMSRDDAFPNLYGQLNVQGLSFQLFDAPAGFSELSSSLSFREQRIFLSNTSGWFGDAPLEASGDFGINPEDGEFHLMCQVPSVEVNALMKTMKMRPLPYPLAGLVTAVFNCQGPLDAPIFVGSGIISRKSISVLTMPLSLASEAVMLNKETGAVAAFDRIPFTHVSANFTFNFDNCVADLYGIRACLLDGGEIRGAGNVWICPEGETDDTAMDVNLSGSFLLEKVLNRYIVGGIQFVPLKIGEVNGETRLSGSLLRPKFDIKWAAPNAEDSFADARGNIFISHDYSTIQSSSIAFDLNSRIETTYIDDSSLGEEGQLMRRTISVVVEGVDLDLRLRGFEFANFASYYTLDSPRPLHLKATGRIKFRGKVLKSKDDLDDKLYEILTSMRQADALDYDVLRLLGDISLSGIKINQLMLAPQSAGFVSISHDAVMLSVVGRPDESFSVEVVGPSWFHSFGENDARTVISVSLQKGQLKAIASYNSECATNIEVRNLPLDELELASLRGFIQKAELQLNFDRRRGHGFFSLLQPKFSGVFGEAIDMAARWCGDVITIEKFILAQTSSKYELQGEYVLPGARDRYPRSDQRDVVNQKAMAGHLGGIMSSMGRWRMRLEVPNAEISEMLPLARLLSRSTDPVVRSRSKEVFLQCLQSAGFYPHSLQDQLKELEAYHDWWEDKSMEEISLPGLAEFSGRWHGSLDALGGGNGDTVADFDFHGEDWEWGTYKTQKLLASGSYSNTDGLHLDKLFIQKDNATLHADGTLLGPVINLHFAVLNFPVGLVPTLFQIIETSELDSILFLRQWLAPVKGIFHMEGDLRGSLLKPECDVQLRLLDGNVGGIDLARAEVVASITPSSRLVFSANFEPVIQSGHVNIQGSIPVAYGESNSEVDTIEKQDDNRQGSTWVPSLSKESGKGLPDDIHDKRTLKEKTEGWDIQLSESLKNLNWNMLAPGEVRINADMKDGGMTLLTALFPHAKWLHGYADIVIQITGTVDQPIFDGSASFHRASISSPVLRKPLTGFGGTININSNQLSINSMESRVGRKGKLSLRGKLPLITSNSTVADKIELKCDVLEVRAKNILSGQVDSQVQVTGSVLQPNISGMIQLSHGEAYVPHDQGNGSIANRSSSSKSAGAKTSGNISTSVGTLSTTDSQQIVEKSADQEKHKKPNLDVRLQNLRLILGPELKIVYPLILNFAVTGELELDGTAHPKFIRPRGILTFENGLVNLLAAQVRLKRDYLNIAKFEPDLGLDPILDLILVGTEWNFKIQSRASTWQDNLVVTSTRSVDQDALSPSEAAKAFETQLAESFLEGSGQLAFKKLATATLETLMPRIEGKGEFGQARWRLVYAPQIPSLLSLDPMVDPLKSLANSISFATEVELQLGKHLQASVVRQMKDSEMATQWTLIYQLTSRLRVLFQSTPTNRLMFEYSTTSQD